MKAVCLTGRFFLEGLFVSQIRRSYDPGDDDVQNHGAQQCDVCLCDVCLDFGRRETWRWPDSNRVLVPLPADDIKCLAKYISFVFCYNVV